jgi:hypothetical protein
VERCEKEGSRRRRRDFEFVKMARRISVGRRSKERQQSMAVLCRCISLVSVLPLSPEREGTHWRYSNLLRDEDEDE